MVNMMPLDNFQHKRFHIDEENTPNPPLPWFPPAYSDVYVMARLVNNAHRDSEREQRIRERIERDRAKRAAKLDELRRRKP